MSIVINSTNAYQNYLYNYHIDGRINLISCLFNNPNIKTQLESLYFKYKHSAQEIYDKSSKAKKEFLISIKSPIDTVCLEACKIIKTLDVEDSINIIDRLEELHKNNPAATASLVLMGILCKNAGSVNTKINIGRFISILRYLIHAFTVTKYSILDAAINAEVAFNKHSTTSLLDYSIILYRYIQDVHKLLNCLLIVINKTEDGNNGYIDDQILSILNAYNVRLSDDTKRQLSLEIHQILQLIKQDNYAMNIMAKLNTMLSDLNLSLETLSHYKSIISIIVEFASSKNIALKWYMKFKKLQHDDGIVESMEKILLELEQDCVVSDHHYIQGKDAVKAIIDSYIIKQIKNEL